jgi:hypothetical protein
MDNMIDGFLSGGWAKTGQSVIRRSGQEWVKASLSKAEDTKLRETIILTLSSRFNIPAVQYWIIAEFSPIDRERWLKEIESVLDGWRYRDPC